MTRPFLPLWVTEGYPARLDQDSLGFRIPLVPKKCSSIPLLITGVPYTCTSHINLTFWRAGIHCILMGRCIIQILIILLHTDTL